MLMSKGIGFIGCGKIAQIRHIPEFSRNPGATIIGYYNPTRSRAEQMAARYGGQVYDDIASLLADLARGRRAGVLYAAWVLVSMVPAGVSYAAGRDFFDRIYDSPRTVAALLAANGALLLLSALAERRSRAGRERPLDGLRALAMGVGQAIAVLPGISRSGTSISFGRLFGLGPKQAAEFSFVMSIPVIAGAALLEFAETGRIQAALDGAEIPGFPVAVGPALAAAALAGAVGYAALRTVVRVLDRGAFWMFGPYCLAAGALAWIFA